MEAKTNERTNISDTEKQEKFEKTLGDSDKVLLNLIAEIIVNIIMEEEE
jgi:hypothetical protein